MPKNKIEIQINEEATELNNIFLNQEWALIEEHKDRVYSIMIDNKKIPYVLKVYTKSKRARMEYENLRKLRFCCVPKVLTHHFSDHFNYIIISKAAGKDLFDHVEENGNMSEPEIKNIAKQLLTTLKIMHKKKIIHRDIKPENIIYDPETEKLVLIDFEERMTEDYWSPEQYRESLVTYKSDMWSVGITLYFLYHGYLPFSGKEIVKKALCYADDISDEFKDFLSCLIHRNVKLRYSAEEALNHIWITK